MKYCQVCGNQLLDAAVVCPRCGCACGPNPQMPHNPYHHSSQYPQNQYGYMHYQNEEDDYESSALANCATIFSFLVPIVGVILGIVGVCKYRDRTLRSQSRLALFLSILFWIIGTVVWIGIFNA